MRSALVFSHCYKMEFLSEHKHIFHIICLRNVGQSTVHRAQCTFLAGLQTSFSDGPNLGTDPNRSDPNRSDCRSKISDPNEVYLLFQLLFLFCVPKVTIIEKLLW